MSFRMEALFSHSSLNVRGMVVHIVNKLIETSDEDSNNGDSFTLEGRRY